MFNPMEKIQHLQASYGYSLILNADINEIVQHNKRLQFISNAVHEAIGCCVCGLTDAAVKLFAFAERLLNDPGINEEKICYSDPRSQLCVWAFDVAIFTWLMYREINFKYINMCLEATQKGESQKGFRPDVEYLRIVVPQCYTLGEYKYGVDLFERYSKKKQIPANFKTKNPGMLAYMLCKQKLGQVQNVDLSLSVKKYLDMELDGDTMLGRGRYMAAATWLKIAYWDGNENPPTPGEVLIKAYDHMSSITKLAGLKAFDVCKHSRIALPTIGADSVGR